MYYADKFYDDAEYVKCLMCGMSCVVPAPTAVECTCSNKVTLLFQKGGVRVHAYNLDLVYVCRKYQGDKQKDFKHYKALGITDSGYSWDYFNRHIKKCHSFTKQITGKEPKLQQIIENALNHYEAYLSQSLKRVNSKRQKQNSIDKKRIPASRHLLENALMEKLLYGGLKTHRYKDDLDINVRKSTLQAELLEDHGVDLHAMLKRMKEKLDSDDVTMVDVLRKLLAKK